MKRAVVLMLVMMFVTASCTPDPRRDADAYATRKLADDTAAAQAQARAQDAELHTLAMARIEEVSQWISTLMMTALMATMFVVLVSFGSFGIGSSFVLIGAGIGAAKRNLLKPNQIRLDPVTRQYPLLITKIDDGKYALSNPNVGSVTMLYDRNPADRMMIQAMAATQHAGALAYQSRLSHKPGEISTIEAPRIEVIEG